MYWTLRSAGGRQQVAVQRGHLHAWHDLDAEALVGSPLARVERRRRLIVVGDGDHVQIGRQLDEVDQVASGDQTVRGARVQVQVRGPEHLRSIGRLASEHFFQARVARCILPIDHSTMWGVCLGL